MFIKLYFSTKPTHSVSLSYSSLYSFINSTFFHEPKTAKQNDFFFNESKKKKKLKKEWKSFKKNFDISFP